METLKEGAYFDYFKLFSGHASDTVRVLELAFKEQLTDEQNNDSASIFKNIKGLLSSYEILVMEINDACKFV